MALKIELPIYYTLEYKRPKTVKRKTKKGFVTKQITERTFLVGMNWYRNADKFVEHKVKEHYHKIILDALEGLNGTWEGKYSVEHKLFYKNKLCDAMNIIAVIDKYFNDAIQEKGLIVDDNVQFYTEGNWSVDGQDKENPRLEIIIRRINE